MATTNYFQNKRYDKSLDEKCSTLAENYLNEFVEQVFGKKEVSVEKNDNEVEKNDYHDWKICVTEDGFNFKCETELKNEKWWGMEHLKKNGIPFKYTNIHVPQRKGKNNADYYFMFSMDGAFCFITKMEYIQESEVIYKYNRYSKGRQEPFFEFDFNENHTKCLFYRKDANDQWRKMNLSPVAN